MEKVNFVQFKQVLDCSLLSTGPVLLEVGLADSASGQSAAQRRSSVGKSSTQSHGEKCALVCGWSVQGPAVAREGIRGTRHCATLCLPCADPPLPYWREIAGWETFFEESV